MEKLKIGQRSEWLTAWKHPLTGQLVINIEEYDDTLVDRGDGYEEDGTHSEAVIMLTNENAEKLLAYITSFLNSNRAGVANSNIRSGQFVPDSKTPK